MSSDRMIKLVLAEDSAPNRQILSHICSKLGFDVHAFADGMFAWEYLKSSEGAGVEIVISDIMMPRMNGLDLLDKIRKDKDLSQLPVIFITAVADKQYITEALQNKVQGYLLKPVSIIKLHKVLKKVYPDLKLPSEVA